MKLKCRNCSYEWDYQGNSKYYATCPRCLRKVKVENSSFNESDSLMKSAKGRTKKHVIK